MRPTDRDRASAAMTGRRPAYLDYNATAPVRPEAARAVASALEAGGNPSSAHGPGREARARVEAAREAVARLVGASPRSVVFTSGGTEANNMALRCAAARGRHLVASAIEHDSVLAAVASGARAGSSIPVGRDGVVDVAALDRELRRSPAGALVSVMAANNETGVIQPVADVVAAARARGAAVHCDGVQGPGKIAVDFDRLGVDLMSLSAHKFGGPQGVGALVARDGAEALEAMLLGGGQERGRRAGTENVPGIAGFGAAAESALADTETPGRVEELRDGLEDRLRSIAGDGIVVGSAAARLPNTSCIAMPGVSAETQVMAFDLDGVGVSAGSACSSGKMSRSHVLDAMGLPEDLAGSAIRVSLGWASRSADVDRFVEVWEKLYRRLGGRDAAQVVAE